MLNASLRPRIRNPPQNIYLLPFQFRDELSVVELTTKEATIAHYQPYKISRSPLTKLPPDEDTAVTKVSNNFSSR